MLLRVNYGFLFARICHTAFMRLDRRAGCEPAFFVRLGPLPIFKARAGKRQQRYVPGALDGAGQHPLVPGARAGLAARPDLSVIGDETAKHVGLLVVDADTLVCAELARLRT
jgi:hypothetical protein